MCLGASGDWKRMSKSQDLEFQAVVNFPMWVIIMNLDPLKEQNSLLTDELSFYPQIYLFCLFVYLFERVSLCSSDSIRIYYVDQT